MHTFPTGIFTLNSFCTLTVNPSRTSIDIVCQHDSWEGNDMVLSFTLFKGEWSVGSSRTLPTDFKDAKRVQEAMHLGFQWIDNHMKRFKMIVAHGEDHLVGIGDKLPWHLPEDLAHFKSYTAKQPVIMGRATYESILGYLGKPLPDRHTYVLTRDTMFDAGFSNVTVVHDVEALLSVVPNNAILCGGASIYALLLPYVNEVSATVVKGTYVEKNDRNAIYLNEFREQFILDEARTQRNLVSKKEISYHIEFWTR
jgi:dihydrofolate reductase